MVRIKLYTIETMKNILITINIIEPTTSLKTLMRVIYFDTKIITFVCLYVYYVMRICIIKSKINV